MKVYAILVTTNTRKQNKYYWKKDNIKDQLESSLLYINEEEAIDDIMALQKTPYVKNAVCREYNLVPEDIVFAIHNE